MVVEEHKKLFGDESLLEYSIDYTDDTCTILEKAIVAMRIELHHQTVKYNILARMVTNTIVAVEASRNTKDVRSLLGCVPLGSSLHGCRIRRRVQLQVWSGEGNYSYGLPQILW
jgi:hypothetical protein